MEQNENKYYFEHRKRKTKKEKVLDTLELFWVNT